MRDLIIAGTVLLLGLIALRHPWVGIMNWTWLSIMNPHRYTYGFAYDAPLAAIAAGTTLLGLFMTRDKRESPFKGAPVTVLTVLTLWLTLSWLFGLSWKEDYTDWDRVLKVNFMVLLSLVLLRTKLQIFVMLWVCSMSLALLGAKGGFFVVATGGNYRVFGPDYSFIADNNHFALALVMTIPLLRFLQMQLTSRAGKLTMTLIMMLVAAAAIGSHSRGALLAIGAMTAIMWWRGRSKLMAGVLIASIALSLLAFMPDSWSDRMATLNAVDQDLSARGRFSAWWVAWGIAQDYFFGAGFNTSRVFLFQKYSPYPELGTPAAHSIWFQMMGSHGFIGFGLFVLLWLTTLSWAGKVRREARDIPEARWCADLAGMIQVSIIGYAVGGTFLSMAYFDLPYDLMALVVITRQWVRRKAWLEEPAYRPRWWGVPGLTRAPAQEK